MNIMDLGKRLAGVILFAAVSYIALSGNNALAQQVKGGQRVMQLAALKTIADVQKVEAGDMVVMSCPKCKTSWIKEVQAVGKGGQKESVTIQRYECPGCETKIVTEGIGKAAKTVLKHVCKQCGSKDAFCCVLKKGEGPTLGMEHSKDPNH